MSTYTPNLSITLRPSRALLATFLFLYLLALASILFINLFWIKAILIAILFISAWSILQEYVLLKSKNSIVKIEIADVQNECCIQTASHAQHQVEIKNIACLFDYFVIVVFQKSAKDFSFVSKKRKVFKSIIAKDVISQEQLYALRLCSKFINH